jgi:hypothetical protein
MAHDLILKSSRHNWSRDLDDVAPVPNSPKLETAIEEKVRAQTAKLSATKAAADRGDKKAQKKWGKICKKVAKIQKAAKAGNPDAVKQVAKINATGLFTIASTATSGDDSLTEIVTSGDDRLTEILTSGDDRLTEILTSGDFVGRQEFIGKDEILGRGQFIGRDEILGRGQFIGEEELALAREGGASERAALARRSNVGRSYGFPHWKAYGPRILPR